MLSVKGAEKDIDWLNSRAGLCKVDLYDRDHPKDKNCEVVCFVDVSKLKDIEKTTKKSGSESGIDSSPSNEFDMALETMEEKDIIVIKDSERSNMINTVCLFKQGSSEDSNVVNWLSNDLQKYATGFQQALSNASPPHKPKPFHHPAANKAAQSSMSSFQGSDPSVRLIPEFGRSGFSPPTP
ncbi:UNVERIFIED_CONTAM: hypothetical protein K2H54_030634 [Gekko kuhli]